MKKKAFKTEIRPSDEQKIKIHQVIGVSRFLYNRYIAYNQEHYERYLEGKETFGFVSGMDFDKYVNNELSKQEGFEWIKGVSSKARKQAIMNGEGAFKQLFKGKAKFPKFKKKRKQDVKAYFPKNNKGDWTIERHRIKIPTIGWVRLKEFGYIPEGEKASSGTISQKAGRYYVSVLIEVDENKKKKRKPKEGIGIDLGLKTFAVFSNGQTYKNINKTKEVRRLEKKLKREQRSLSRKQEVYKHLKTKGGEPATNEYKRKNVQKNVLRVQKLYQRLANIRKEYVRSVVDRCVKTKPTYITIEDLNVRGMMKNRHLSKAIAGQNFYAFSSWLKAKCVENDIELRRVDRFYPSSKLCSSCGAKKKDLKLKDRVYTCECGNTMDRDKNAALNLLKAKEYAILT
ncbi:transposase [Halolactibacillus alkaliphilus]|uniref:Transposase n=1 Tax=Halolactibacillus alkaliphilus TaxID=442899 RepID=A0A511WYA4_9BACI|nr:RNA-guided endonuclease TnpB family protein [Halolactibacillus alkaliphilus]GEN55997.1 transposase [Halolactibacillus alkaliphilus]GGN68197.1 transposase [Halolactibacillus alkaliphilus]SFO69538.1 putative transposase [Halolactibacillus alkaliphilus]